MANGSLWIRHLGEAGNVDVWDVEIRDVQVRDMVVRVTGAGEGDEAGQDSWAVGIISMGWIRSWLNYRSLLSSSSFDAITVGVRQGCSSRQSYVGIRNFQR